MFNYTVRRLISAIPVLFIVAVMVFALIHMIPGNPAAVMLGSDATQEEIDALSEKLGLNEPVPVQLVKWFGDALRGDMGDSIYYSRPVTEILAERLEPTFLIVVYAILVAIAIGVPLGILAAVYHNHILDKLCMIISMIGISCPSFWLGLNLVILFAVQRSIFPSVGYVPIAEGGLATTLYYITLPSFALGLQRSASIARVTRSGMLDVLNNDYIRTARAKGLGELFVIAKHALKNAMNPILTQVGMSLAQLIGGAVVIETIFNIPGLGLLAFDSLKRRDYPMIQGHILFVAMAYILINLIIDLLYRAFDPRVDYQ